jgi:hypothetical protein
MGKIIWTLLIAVVFFAAGYIAGARRMGPLEKDLSATHAISATKDLWSEEKTELTKKLDKALLRLRLAELRECFEDAQSEVTDKNFGTADTEIQEAKKTLDSLLGDAKDDLRKELTPIAVGLDEAKTGIEKNDPKVKAKLENLRTQVAEIEKKLAE